MKKQILKISLIILFSCGLWISVSLSETYISTIEVPVTFTDLPKNYSIGYSSAETVLLQIKGRGWEFANLSITGKKHFDVSVHRRIGKLKNDLKNFIEANNWLTSTFQVIEIAPSQIEYSVERVGSKLVPIVGDLKIEFKEGYGPTSLVKIDPDKIEITGPLNLLQTIDTLKTLHHSLSGISNNVRTEIPIYIPDGINVTEKNCTVEFEVQKIVDKTFESLFVETRNVPENKELNLSPVKINVVLRGGINKLGRLTNDSLSAFVDYWKALKETGKTIEPVIQIPPFTTLVNVHPKKLEYIIKQY